MSSGGIDQRNVLPTPNTMNLKATEEQDEDEKRVIRAPLAPVTTSVKVGGVPGNLRNFVNVFKDMMKAINALHFEAGRYHGDITISNVCWYYRPDGKAVGVLPELDDSLGDKNHSHAKRAKDNSRIVDDERGDGGLGESILAQYAGQYGPFSC